ncbi:hypothetical protein SAMN05216564_11213 [Halopenitus persicus]|uniref:Uncharacterized protein n=1 Tax=Halopenitus persicus TaxID=1048396 RepID=A0A1H3N9P8_9EURY|nr:hypothetical protein SAMN05216564_11213 [Halopenitus persicus]
MEISLVVDAPNDVERFNEFHKHFITVSCPTKHGHTCDR